MNHAVKRIRATHREQANHRHAYISGVNKARVVVAGFQVDMDAGTVHVFDVIAGHFTVHHALTELQEHEVLEAARDGRFEVRVDR